VSDDECIQGWAGGWVGGDRMDVMKECAARLTALLSFFLHEV
jgi:hypothetical protein